MRAALASHVERRPGLTVGAAAFVLMAVWGLFVPLFAGPDENSNFVRAAAVIRGEVIGGDLPASLDDNYFRTTVGIDPQFVAANPIPFCFAPFRNVAACNTPLDTAPVVDDPPFTFQGRYPPVAFVVPGLGTLVGPNDMAVRLGRLADSAAAAALIGIAAARLVRSSIPLVVLLVAWTPGAQFMGAVINPSGVEIAAAIAVWAYGSAALNVGRGPWTRRDDVGLAVASVALLTARPASLALFAIIAVCCAIAMAGRNPVTALLRRAPITIASSAVASVGMLVWYFVVFDVHLDDGVADGAGSIGRLAVLERAFGHMTTVVAEHVGNFGWGEVDSPTLAVWFFLLATAAVIAAGWRHSTRREQAAVLALGVAVVVFEVYLSVNFYRLLRVFGVQGRHLSPLIVGLPLLLAHRWRPSDRQRRLLAVTWTAVLAVTAVFVLRRYAVGTIPGNFFDLFSEPRWTPPFGTIPMLLALVGATGVFAVVCSVSSSAPARADAEVAGAVT